MACIWQHLTFDPRLLTRPLFFTLLRSLSIFHAHETIFLKNMCAYVSVFFACYKYKYTRKKSWTRRNQESFNSRVIFSSQSILSNSFLFTFLLFMGLFSIPFRRPSINLLLRLRVKCIRGLWRSIYSLITVVYVFSVHFLYSKIFFLKLVASFFFSEIIMGISFMI